MSKVSILICKLLMKISPSIPDPFDPNLWEVFKTDHYTNGTPDHQKQVRYQSASASYEYEQNQQDSWLEKYFFPRINARTKGKSSFGLRMFYRGRLAA